MIAKLPKRKKLPKKKPRIKKETSHKERKHHIKYYHSWGSHFATSFFIMHEIIKLLHESILLETVTLVIYAI